MLNYLRRVDDVTRGKLRWGILTNGRQWRLYFQGADSVSEEYLEIDLAGVFRLPGYQPELDEAHLSSDHVFRLFVLLLGRDAFLSAHHGQTLHALVRNQGKHWESNVAADLSRIVFEELYPKLVTSIAEHDSKRDARLSAEYLSEVRQGALILLYRLLFVLYAEDRHLLPVERDAYQEFALNKLRDEIAKKFFERSEFSERATLYWARLETIFRAIGEGDDTLGIPPYNGGLFQQAEAPILARCKLPDRVLADIIFPLSHEKAEPRLKYINYRDLSVQQLGSIYERLLEFDVVAEDSKIAIRLNPFARKGSGSYYTPEPLVKLIIERAVGPLVAERLEQFRVKADELSKSRKPVKERLDQLAALDPASRILELKVCDPAMGSGHFLVSLVDWMADRVLAAIDHAAELVDWADDPPYESPLIKRISTIRSRIQKRAKEHHWPLPERQLDERNIVRRMILKRCVYGVDLNPMAVELAKVSLWLHTFTVGAPLSFLDHHLRCGESLFGEHVRGALDWLEKRGTIMVSHIIAKAKAVAAGMAKVEALTDADIAEVRESETNFEAVESGIRPIVALLDFIQVQRWQDPKDDRIKALVSRFFDGQYGDPLLVLDGRPSLDAEFAKFYEQCRKQIAEQRFLHWEVAFPGVWSNWESAEPRGGFDAVIGNPPWDRIKFQEVEWFAERKPEIAKAQRAADRKTMVAALKKNNDPLALAHEKAVARAEAAARVARTIGDYPLLSGGDTNIYSLFVERASTLIKPSGMVGLVTPIGIGTDKTSAKFFSQILERKRVNTFLSFENRGGWLFDAVHHEDQPTAFVFSGTNRQFADFPYGVKLRTMPTDEYILAHRLTAAICKKINPNTGTVPIFRTMRDSEIVAAIYSQLPILTDRSSAAESSAYPVKYHRMFDMTNDSRLFRTKDELEKREHAYPTGQRHWRDVNGEWLPLFEGKMISIFNHRYASVGVNAKNVSGQGVAIHSTEEQLADPDFVTMPRYWVRESEVSYGFRFALGFNDVCNTNNYRSLISALIPHAAYGNKLPILISEREDARVLLVFLVGNFNSIVCDYTARQKIQSRNLNKYILEQLPIVPREAYARKFGNKSAADIVTGDVLALTYTANDMEPFARDMGYSGKPFKWDDADRARRRARLDALYFMLYFPSQTKAEIEALRETAHYIFSTFPIVEREDKAAHGRYLSRDLCLATINALAAGDPDANISL
jgi:Eco57I restriction-modification methylase